MLVLSRNHQESFTVITPSGEEIIIRVLDATRDKAMLGIEAPKDYLILREELQKTG
jgi:carbon storage regulator CsrA